MTLGQKLKQLRVERGITTRKISELFNVGKSTISNYENDVRKPDHEMLKKLADFYNVSTDYLLGKVPERELVKLEENLPEELKEVGINYIVIAKEAQDSGVSEEIFKIALEFAKKMMKENK